MELPNSSRRNNSGFTLIEVLIVIAFIAIVGGAAAFFGADSFRSYLFHTDRELLVTSLLHARAQAVGNICLGSSCSDGKPHGVKMLADKFVAFQGQSYDTRDTDADANFEANPNLIHGGTVTEIVFTQLSATTTGGSMTLTDSTGRISTIAVNSEGQISWSN